MKTVGFRSIVLYILLAAFLLGAGYLAVELAIHGGDWAMQPYNGHLYDTAELGKITDRNGHVLAYTDDDGDRLYGESEAIRRALLHTVGDTRGYISTGVQHSLSDRLTGYNFVTGLSDLPFGGIDRDVALTVDQDACAAAYGALEGRNGAALVYNYKTGEVLVKVSAPGFDPENEPEDLNDDPAYNGVYLDNTLSASFTPGSIFKLVTLAAAMEKWPDSWSQRAYACEGSMEIGGSEITCFDHTAHGTQTAAEALGNSCNVYFAQLANDIGGEALQAKAEAMGFNRSFSFDSIPTAESEIDLSHADANQLGWAGVGQYTVLVNPGHMLLLMGSIANGGEAVPPRLTKSAGLLPGLSGGEKLVTAAEAVQLKALMRSNVENYYGDWNFPAGLNVCAKTGTGEVGEEKGPNCWMVGFCDNAQYPYAFAVVVEDGPGGMAAAGPVVSAALSALVD